MKNPEFLVSPPVTEQNFSFVFLGLSLASRGFSKIPDLLDFPLGFPGGRRRRLKFLGSFKYSGRLQGGTVTKCKVAWSNKDIHGSVWQLEDF